MEDILKNWFSIEEFVQLMVDIKIGSTSDFIKAKKEGDLPKEIPDKPLQAYPELEGQWSVLWDKVRSLRLSQEKDVAERRKWIDEELRITSEVFEELNKKEPEVDLSSEREDSSIDTQKEGDVDHQNREALRTGNQHNSQINEVGESVPEGQREIGRKSLSSHISAARIAHNERLRKNKEEEALFLITENPQIKGRELAEKMQISTALISKIISSLKKGGHLVRVGGSGKYGYWEVFKRGEKVPFVSPQSKLEKKALSLIKKNPQVKRKELSKQLQVSVKLINKIISKLKMEGRLVKVGGKSKYGYWKVL